MTQDTRKDRRVKIVSLNVRYKSATVDEFIENHAHDVSRGGIFIKTANPFPAGTLLKFEIRLASDQAVIAGVGRVVWKRDAGGSSGERPAGMGVKFIKIDEPSKAVVDRLMNTRADAGISFESNDEVPTVGDPQGPRTIPPIRPAAGQSSVPSVVAARSMSPAAGTVGARAAGATGSSTSDKPPPVRKATMIGMGKSPLPAEPGARPAGPSGLPPRPTPFSSSAPSAPPRPGTPGAMFPRMGFDSDRPPKEEQTVMRQAAELLEDALREAGGSMEDVGTNPLFGGSPRAAGAAAAKPAAPATPAPIAPPSERLAAAAPQSIPGTVSAKRVTDDAALQQPTGSRRSDLPRETAPSLRTPPPASVRASQPGPTKASSATSTMGRPAEKKGGSGTLVVIGIAAAAIALGILMFRDRLFGDGSAPAPETAPGAQTAPPMASAPSVVIAPTAPTPAPSSASPGAPSASASPPASASASAAPAPVPSPTQAAPSPPARAVRPAPARTAPPAPAAPEATEAPPAVEKSATPGGEVTSPSTPGTTKPATAAPKPKSGKPTDDNPY